MWNRDCGDAETSSTHTVFSRINTYIDRRRPLETVFDIIVNLWSSLAQIGPFIWVLGKSVLVSTLCAPNDTSRSSLLAMPII
jgi:hypothetical protein